MKMGSGTAVLALAAVFAPAAAAAADPKDQSRSTLTHIATGFRFPAAVGAFERVSINAFNAAATDIAIGYASLTPGSQVAVTVYITPAPSVEATGTAQAQSCDKQFAAMDSRFAQRYPNARQLVRGNVRSPSPMYGGTGRQVIYDYEDVFYGQRQTLRSETDLFCYISGNWLVAYRSTAPVKVDYAPKLAMFMRSLAWPAPGSGKTVDVPQAAPAGPAPQAASGNRIPVRIKVGATPAVLAGLVVIGDEADLARFEAEASRRGVDARRMTENGKTQSIASLLKPEIRLADAADLYRQTRDGKFGKVSLELLLIQPDANGNERDLLSRAGIFPASAVEAF